MGLFDFIRRIFTSPTESDPASDPFSAAPPVKSSAAPSDRGSQTRPTAQRRSAPPVVLSALNYQSSLVRTPEAQESVERKPYRFAFPGSWTGNYLDLSQDCDPRWLEYYGLPILKTPDDLAGWLHIPIGQLAWLTHRMQDSRRAASIPAAHYHYRWMRKRSHGQRLIEAPKPILKQAQQRILREILDQVPAHPKAHGFVPGRSIVTNARPHVGKRFVLKFDLANFYATVRYTRVVAIFRSLGFSREVGIWLARLTTTAIPWSLDMPPDGRYELRYYQAHHLPQGAPTSPALANLSAFGLDVRLSGLAERYGMTYTRYADDLTFSGRGRSVPALRQFIPLVTKIVRAEKFHVNDAKRRVIRNCQRQSVTGVVVNQRPNISRVEFDRLKAILHNCIRHGPTSQNREQHEDWQAHLRGRIAHVLQLNASRGQKLLAMFQQIDWTR